MRRVTTGFDNKGKSKVLEDTKIPVTMTYEQFPDFAVTELFYTEESPQHLRTEHKQRPYELELPPGAFRFCAVTIPPLTKLITHAKNTNISLPQNEKDYLLHKTNSMDYVYVTKGEIVLRLDNGEEKLLKPGDFVMQKGAVHAWNNLTTEPCEMIAVMIGTPAPN